MGKPVKQQPVVAVPRQRLARNWSLVKFGRGQNTAKNPPSGMDLA